jgi:hypothetical protein
VAKKKPDSTPQELPGATPTGETVAKIHREMCLCGHEKTRHDFLPGTEHFTGVDRLFAQGAGRCLECDCGRWTFKYSLVKDGQPTDFKNAEVLHEITVG